MPGGLHPPLTVVASWPTPNYIDPVSHGNALFVITVVTLTLIPIVVSARLWARFVVLRKPGWDDFLLCIAMVRTAYCLSKTINSKVISYNCTDSQYRSRGLLSTLCVLFPDPQRRLSQTDQGLADHVYYFRRHIWDVPLNIFVPATIVHPMIYALNVSNTKLGTDWVVHRAPLSSSYKLH